MQLFFAVSAYTLLTVDQHENYGRFLVRRAFRIAPMFYLAICFYVAVLGMGPRFFSPSGITPLDVAATFAFLHDWLPNAADSVVPGGFTVGCEAMFYLAFPLLARLVNNLPRAVAFLAISLVVSVGLYLLIPHIVAGPPAQIRSFSYFIFPAQLPAFAMGFVAYHAVKASRDRAWAMRAAGLAMAPILAAIAILALADTEVSRLHLLGDLLLGALLGAVAIAPPRWIDNRVMTYLGRVSFSVYIVHFAVIAAAAPLARMSPIGGLAFYPMVLGVSVAIASLTWRFIETPMIHLGRRVSQRMAGKGEAPARLGAQGA